MTEADWLKCDRPDQVVKAYTRRLDEAAHGQAQRLFAAACARACWGRLPEHWRRGVEVQERAADPWAGSRDPDPAWAIEDSQSARRFVGAFWWVFRQKPLPDFVTEEEKAVHPAILRDIFGNPFRPVAFDPAWRTPLVLSLARRAYQEPALPGGTLDEAGLAVLADALLDAGCNNGDVLEHLRGDGPHWLGCWAVDSCLGCDPF